MYIYIYSTVYNSDCRLSHLFASAGRSVLRKLVTEGRAESFRLAVPTESNGRDAGVSTVMGISWEIPLEK